MTVMLRVLLDKFAAETVHRQCSWHQKFTSRKVLLDNVAAETVHDDDSYNDPPGSPKALCDDGSLPP